MDIKLGNGSRITSIDSSENKRSSRGNKPFENIKFEDIVIDRFGKLLNQEDFVKFDTSSEIDKR